MIPTTFFVTASTAIEKSFPEWWSENRKNLQLDKMSMLAATIFKNPYIPVTHLRPSPRQIEFLAYLGEEALFGGQAGGGKSDALLMAALQFVEVPGYKALIIRRTFADLNQDGGLISRSREWFQGKNVKWNQQDHRWTFPSGATLTFGYFDTDAHYKRYQGGEWHFVGFDEVTQFQFNWYSYLFSRQRKLESMDVTVRMRCTANPGGIGHAWVKARFIDAKTAKYFFVQSRLADNPGLDKEDYKRKLMKLDYVTRKQLMDGDWNEFSGGRFLAGWFLGFRIYVDNQRVKRIVLQDGDERGIVARSCWTFVTVDPAASTKTTADYTVIMVFAVTPCRKILIIDVIRQQCGVDKIIPLLEKTCREYTPKMVGIESNGFQVQILNEAMRSPHIPSPVALLPEGHDKLVRATPAINRASQGQVYLPDVQIADNKHPWIAYEAPWLEDFLAEVVSFTGDEEKDSHDDMVDCLAYGVQMLDRSGLAGPMLVQPDEDTHYDDSAYYGR